MQVAKFNSSRSLKNLINATASIEEKLEAKESTVAIMIVDGTGNVLVQPAMIEEALGFHYDALCILTRNELKESLLTTRLDAQEALDEVNEAMIMEKTF